MKMTLNKIILGGQTGVDQAALDVAIKLGIPHGGWIPKGRRTAVGKLSDKYMLKEMPSSSYVERTKQNVIDSDGTLIICRGQLTGGSLLTQKFAEQHNKTCLHIDLAKNRGFSAAQSVKSWIDQNSIRVLNITGPLATEDPNIYEDAIRLLKAVYSLFNLDCCESTFI